MYANIIIDISHEQLDRIFQYNIPSHLEGIICVGLEVLVPFGRGNRLTSGYVVGIQDAVDYDETKVKSINSIIEHRNAIGADLIRLAVWMRENYGGTLIQSLKTVLPSKTQKKHKEKKYIRLLVDDNVAKERLQFFLSKNQKARARLLQALMEHHELHSSLDYEIATSKLNITRSVFQALEEQGLLTIETQEVYRNPVSHELVSEYTITFTREQEAAIRAFGSDYEQGTRNTYLIHGITGSGKTELYMEMIRQVVASGKQAIVLIPEIALTYQTVRRFYRLFGDRISIMNSRLSAGERYDQMKRAEHGEVDVMIGPRSALFTPFAHLGLIVIDEEHEGSYKSEVTPRYHARETAIKRAEIAGASVVLGSATPSLEAMYQAKEGKYILLELKQRSRQQALAVPTIVDMREETKQGNLSILSDELDQAIRETLHNKEQIMLFLNRRGYAGYISCRSCGYVIMCPHCDVSLSLHQQGQLLCHYCGYQVMKPPVCPECQSIHIGEFKAGTQQIQELLNKQYPQARVLRMDLDTTKQKHGHEVILETYANGDADILLGTQMIVKGHDFPNVTLVGILAADMSLLASDYRCAERTFQLLTQAIGRAGRGEKVGRAIIQTNHPDHYAIQASFHQNYEMFYQAEISYRRLLDYPPTAYMMALHIQGEDLEIVEKACYYLKQYISGLKLSEGVQVIGPGVPNIGRIQDVHRKVIYLKTQKYDTLIREKSLIERYIEINSGFKKLRIIYDLNP